VRASKPDELWHVDMTVIRLLDGTKVYLHAVIDNFSRRILAWRVTENFSVATTVAILQEADQGAATRGEPPTLLADAGVENVNSDVDGLIESGLIRGVLTEGCHVLQLFDRSLVADTETSVVVPEYTGQPSERDSTRCILCRSAQH